MIVIVLAYVSLMASFASPSLFVVSLPLTYIACRSTARQRRSATSRARKESRS